MRVFVFESNEVGRHKAGSAKTALEKYGAVYGRGRGLQGSSYAIPVKDIFMRVRRLDQIKRDIDVFLQFAKENEGVVFKVSKVGCGVGYDGEVMARLFMEAGENVVFTKEWDEIVKRLREEQRKEVDENALNVVVR